MLNPGVSNMEVLVSVSEGIDMVSFYMNNNALYSDTQTGFTLKVETTDKTKVDVVANLIKALGFGQVNPLEIIAFINDVINVIRIAFGALGIIELIIASIWHINTCIWLFTNVPVK